MVRQIIHSTYTRTHARAPLVCASSTGVKDISAALPLRHATALRCSAGLRRRTRCCTSCGQRPRPRRTRSGTDARARVRGSCTGGRGARRSRQGAGRCSVVAGCCGSACWSACPAVPGDGAACGRWARYGHQLNGAPPDEERRASCLPSSALPAELGPIARPSSRLHFVAIPICLSVRLSASFPVLPDRFSRISTDLSGHACHAARRHKTTPSSSASNQVAQLQQLAWRKVASASPA